MEAQSGAGVGSFAGFLWMASVGGVMASSGLRVDGWNATKVGVGSSFLLPTTGLSRRFSLGASKRRVGSVSPAQEGIRVGARNAVSTAKRGGFGKVSDDDYAENFRPPHITDVFDVPARPSTFCAKTR